MLMAKLDRLIEKYGQPVIADCAHGKFNTHAFIQPLRYKNKMYLDLDIDRLGKIDDGCYLYIGKADVPLRFKTGRTEIKTAQGSFSVVRAETVGIGNRAIYIWAILNPIIREGEYV